MTSPYEYLADDVYALRTEGDGYRVTKFTKDLNPVGFYHIKEDKDGSFHCNCPQSNRGPCKHLDIVDSYTLYPERIDKGWFFCQQTGDWFPPVERAEEERLGATSVEAIEQPTKQTPSTEPPAAGGGEADGPSTAPPVTPEVEASPPSLPSGVMVFSEPLKRRI